VRLQHAAGKAEANGQAAGSQEAGGSAGSDDDEGGRSGASGVGVSMAYVGKLLRAGHDAPLTSLAFSADGGVLAATLASGHLTVYECARWVACYGR